MLTNSSNFYLRARTSWDLLKKPMSGGLSEQKGKEPSQNKEVRAKLQEIYDFLVDFTTINAYAYPDKK